MQYIKTTFGLGEGSLYGFTSRQSEIAVHTRLLADNLIESLNANAQIISEYLISVWNSATKKRRVFGSKFAALLKY